MKLKDVLGIVFFACWIVVMIMIGFSIVMSIIF